MKDERRYYAEEQRVYDRERSWVGGHSMDIAQCVSATIAKRIAAALNVYRPKVRRQKPAEKEVNSRPLSR